jgi:glycogen(starch) synthase
MKIAILSDRIPPENAGGAERVAWSLACALRDSGHAVHVIAATAGPAFREVRAGIPTYHISTQIPVRLRAWQGVYNPVALGPLRELFTEIHPDVVNAHNVHGALSWSALSVARACGYPVVFTAHDLMTVAYGKLTHFVRKGLPYPLDPREYRLPVGYNLRTQRFRYNPARNAIIRRILNRCEVRICVSETQREALVANGLTGVQVVYNGVDPAEFDRQVGDSAVYRAAILHDRPTALFAGRLNREKGSDWLFAAWPAVQRAVPEAQLLLLSRPESVASLQSRFPNVMANAIVGGWLSGRQLASAFCAVDAVVVPSIFLESFPLVALEAMAANKPVVASRIGGLGEIVEDHLTGLTVPVLDVDALSDALVQLFKSPSLAAAYGRAGRARLEAHFTLDRQVQRMLEVFQSAITLRGAV